MKLLRAQIELMSQKLKENNIDFEEHLDIKFNVNWAARSNSPTIEGQLSTLTTERITKGVVWDKTRSENNDGNTSLSGNCSDDKRSTSGNKYNQQNLLCDFSKSRRLKNEGEETKVEKKMVRKKFQRDESTYSSNSSQFIPTSRTAPVKNPHFATQSVHNNEGELLDQISRLQKEVDNYKAMELKRQAHNYNDHKLDLYDKYKLYEENVKDEEFEKPVSFRDNHEDKFDKLEWDSEFDYEKFEQKLNQQKKRSDDEALNEDKPKVKKLAKWYDKDEIMKMFDHIESELSYNQYFNNTKKQTNNFVLIQDEELRIWQIARKDIWTTRNLSSLSSLKSLDSPVSISSENLRFSTNASKNKTALHNIIKLSIDKDHENSNKSDSDLADGGYQVTLKWDMNTDRDYQVIDYQVMDASEVEINNQRSNIGIDNPTDQMEINYFDLY